MVWGEPEREQLVALSSVNSGWTLAALSAFPLSLSLSFVELIFAAQQ